jgi:hypothetical protein
MRKSLAMLGATILVLSMAAPASAATYSTQTPAVEVSHSVRTTTPPPPPSLNFGLNGCVSWFHYCITLNHTDEIVLAAGFGTFLAMALCRIPVIGWVGCGAITGAMAAAAAWIGVRGVCRYWPNYQLQVEVFPNPGQNIRCVR